MSLLVPPFSIKVIGLSVSDLKVKHLTLRAVVSSWIPPESVRTKLAPSMSETNSIYPSGLIMRIPSERILLLILG